MSWREDLERRGVPMVCVICGDRTDNIYSGHYCCEVYDGDGKRRKACKYWLRRTTGDPGAEIPPLAPKYRTSPQDGVWQ